MTDPDNISFGPIDFNRGILKALGALRNNVLKGQQ